MVGGKLRAAWLAVSCRYFLCVCAVDSFPGGVVVGFLVLRSTVVAGEQDVAAVGPSACPLPLPGWCWRRSGPGFPPLPRNTIF